jgi:hypothetical protein
MGVNLANPFSETANINLPGGWRPPYVVQHLNRNPFEQEIPLFISILFFSSPPFFLSVRPTM